MNYIIDFARILFVAISVTQVYAQQNGLDEFGYPAYDSVAVRVAAHYRVTENDTMWYGLAKKPDGWYVYTVNRRVTPNTYGDFTLCWNKATGKYADDLTRLNKGEDYDAALRVLLHPSNKSNFYERCLYYGYRGCTDDVFHALEGKDKLTDRELEVLALAYARESFYRVSFWSDYSVLERSYTLEDRPNCMTQAQLDTFIFYGKAAVKTYGLLRKQNPLFETFVGNVFTKESNEIMSMFLILAHYQNLEEAMKVLRPGLYDPFMRNVAENFLKSCPSNSILFTQGDNDTYPLLYLQAQEGVRRDVLVVNLSMLNTSRYINFLRPGVFDAAGFPMKLNPEDYANDRLDYLSVTDEQAMKLIKASGKEVKPASGALYKADIAMLDMLAANNGKRPVCFAMTVTPEAVLGMHQFVTTRGLVYQLHNKKQDKLCTMLYDAKVDVAFNYDFVLNNMTYTNWATLTFKDDMMQRFGVNYQTVFWKTAEELINKRDTAKAYMVIDKFLHEFPDDIMPYGVFMFKFPELLSKCGQSQRGEQVAVKILVNAARKYDDNIELLRQTINCAECETGVREGLYSMQELLAYGKLYHTGKDWVEKLDKDFRERYMKYNDIKGGQ